ncbi:hypothetical protein RM190_00555 [Paracoccus sp. CPCC 101403]|uniref:Phage tail assembly protein n=1 Tax=Paracoccus broussonetiae TaxID=3075834 RepID=A0ABU3E7X5_9RHOB|nr:hypothetical protein [Paracoccus sp. CPCC 101403]MDT1060323.1 hypothetical protein [Paracoccus sp. CPCC 101403]
MNDPFSLETETLNIGGHDVVVSMIAARDMLAMQRATSDDRIFALLAAAVTLDGRKVSPEEVALWPMATVNQILPAALRLNGLEAATEADADEPEDTASGNEEAA